VFFGPVLTGTSKESAPESSRLKHALKETDHTEVTVLLFTHAHVVQNLCEVRFSAKH